MAAGPKLRGQDVLVSLVRAGVLVAEFPVESATVSILQETDSTRYLGERANRFDENFEGFEIQIEGHGEGSGAAGWDAMIDHIISRAQRTAAPTAINCTMFHDYPNGDLKGYTYLDLKASGMSTSHSGNEFVGRSITLRCGERKAL